MNAPFVRVVVPIEANATLSTRLPPFGREVADAVRRKQRLNVFVYATADAWNRASARRAGHGPGTSLVLPPGEDPAAYYWPIVPNGVLVVANGKPRALAFDLARAIVSCGTPLAAAVFGDGDLLIVRSTEWRETLEHAA